jgi:tetratricopeptide (TPR) repeat protein
LLKIDAKNTEGWNTKGLALAGLERTQEALDCFDKCIEINQRDLKAWGSKGLVLEKSEMFQEALDCYDKALELNPKDDFIWQRKGATLFALKISEEALKWYEKVLKVQPNNIDAWQKKSLIMGLLKKPKEALECINKVLKLDPKNIDGLITKAKFLQAQGMFEEALKCLDKILALASNVPEVWIEKGNLIADSAWNKVRKIMWDARGQLQNDQAIDEALKKIDAVEEEVRDALKCIDKALELNPNDPKAEKDKEGITNLFMNMFQFKMSLTQVQKYNPNSKYFMLKGFK